MYVTETEDALGTQILTFLFIHLPLRYELFFLREWRWGFGRKLRKEWIFCTLVVSYLSPFYFMSFVKFPLLHSGLF